MFLFVILYGIFLAITYAKMDSRIDELESEIKELKNKQNKKEKSD